MEDTEAAEVHRLIAVDDVERISQIEEELGSIARILDPTTGYTPMMTVAYHGSHNVLGYFLSRGMSADSRAAHDETPIMIAIWRSHEDTAVELIAHTKRPNLQYAGSTALATAVMLNKRRLAKELLDRGADPDVAGRGALSARDHLVNADSAMRKLVGAYGKRNE